MLGAGARGGGYNGTRVDGSIEHRLRPSPHVRSILIQYTDYRSQGTERASSDQPESLGKAVVQ